VPLPEEEDVTVGVVAEVEVPEERREEEEEEVEGRELFV